MTTSREELADEVQSRLVTYLGEGKPINEEALTRALDFSGLSITDFARLKRIRFVLSERVQTYLDKLDQRIRRIRTASEVETQRAQGELRGAIDWGQTIRERYSSNPKDRSLFVARTPYTEYQLPENILLKVFLSVIHQTATDEITGIDKQWRRERWRDRDIDQFQRLYRRNVHLDRIDADSDTPVRSRHLNAARLSRHPLYFEAYDHYSDYQQLLNNEFDNPEVADLLYETLIVPDTATLFELTCVFRLLDRFQEAFHLTLNPIEREHDAIARLENDQWQLLIYHDAQGSLRFREPLPDVPEDQYLQRYQAVLAAHQEIMDRDSRRPLYTGRPDIVVEAYRKTAEDQQLRNVLLGEVKHTDTVSTLSTGVLQLQEYLMYARLPEPPGDEDGSPFLADYADVSVTGLVLTDGVTQRDRVGKTVHLNADQLFSVDPSLLLDLAPSTNVSS